MLFKISHFQDNERARFCVMLFLYTVDMTVNEMKEYRNHDIYVSSIVCFFLFKLRDFVNISQINDQKDYEMRWKTQLSANFFTIK